MQQVIESLSEQPIVCIILSDFIFLFASLLNYLLVDALLKMHRSKSAVKKIKKEYTFRQRMCLLHLKDNCRHAVKFCNCLIVFQKIGWGFFAIYFLMSLLFVVGLLSVQFLSWFTVTIFIAFAVPSFTVNWILSRPLFSGRFKEYSFEKYHNTDNYESLF